MPLETFAGSVVDVPDLTEQVYGSLRGAILDGTLSPGERLPEVTLARKLRVSRSPVREALRQLATEGLVTMAPGRGAMVTQPDPAYIREVFLVRNPLEATAARLAAQLARPDHLAELHATQADLARAAVSQDFPDIHQIANRFHTAIYTAAGSALLARILTQMQEALQIFRHSDGSQGVDPARVHREHGALLEAIEGRDPDAAEKAMWAHMRLAESGWIAALKTKVSSF